MTDFFDDLERELRRAHRRDTERHARSRVFVRRRLPGLLATGRRTLVALAVIAALVAVVVTVARESDVERPAAPPAPKPTLMECLEATGLTASPQSAADVMILKDKQHAVVVGVTDMYLAPTDAVKQVVDRGHAHRIGNYVVEFHDGKGDHAAIRQCIREAPNDAPPGASDGRSPLMICLEATGLTPKPLSTADHMIFMDDDGDLVVKIVLGEALARETMPDYVHAHRIGNYYFEFHGGKGDRTAIRTCIKENK